MVHLRQERILITGATGFIGMNLARTFHAKKIHVFGTTQHTPVSWEYGTLTRLDLLDDEEIKTVLSSVRPTIIFHFGAHVVLKRDYETAVRCFEVNLKGTLNLLEHVKDMRCFKRFIFLSTEEIYGNGSLPYYEDQFVFPPSPYAVSKLAAEHLCLLYYRLYHIPTVILRLATVYGPFQPLNRFIPSLITSALRDEEIIMHSGTNRRDYLFVDDAVNAFLRAAQRQTCIGEIINLGDQQSVAGREVIDAILKLTTSRSKVQYGVLPDREGEAPEWRSNITKAKKLLGWEPHHSFEEGLQKTIAWYRTSRELS